MNWHGLNTCVLIILCDVNHTYLPGIKERGNSLSLSSDLSITCSKVIMLIQSILLLFILMQGCLCVPKLGCTTVAGPDKGKACVFPFRYYGGTFNECAPYGTDRGWCSTLTDSNGNHMSGQGKWGICPSDCGRPTTTPSPPSGCKTVGGNVPGKPCVFPFRFRGILYNECTMEMDTKLWCSTSTNSDNDHQTG